MNPLQVSRAHAPTTRRSSGHALRCGVLAVVVAVLGGCGGARSPAAKPVDPAEQARAQPPELRVEVKGLLERYRQGWEVKSLEALSALYVRTLDVALITGGGELLGWTAIEAALKESLASNAMFKLKVEPVAMTVVAAGGAVVVAKVVRIYGDDVTKTEDRELVTFVLTPFEGHLAIVLEHRSRAPQR